LPRRWGLCRIYEISEDFAYKIPGEPIDLIKAVSLMCSGRGRDRSLKLSGMEDGTGIRPLWFWISTSLGNSDGELQVSKLFEVCRQSYNPAERALA